MELSRLKEVAAMRTGSVLRCAALSLSVITGACSSAFIDTLACASPDGPYGRNTRICEDAHDQLRRDRERRNTQSVNQELLAADEERRMKDPKYRAAKAEAKARYEARLAEMRKQHARAEATWQRELAAEKVVKAKNASVKSPELAWLSGIWCRPGRHDKSGYLQRFEILNSQGLRLVEYYYDDLSSLKTRKIEEKFIRVGRKGSRYYIVVLNEEKKQKTLIKIKRKSGNKYVELDKKQYSYKKEVYNNSSSIEGYYWIQLMNKNKHEYNKCG